MVGLSPWLVTMATHIPGVDPNYRFLQESGSYVDRHGSTVTVSVKHALLLHHELLPKETFARPIELTPRNPRMRM